jgi:hypothetical protein
MPQQRLNNAITMPQQRCNNATSTLLFTWLPFAVAPFTNMPKAKHTPPPRIASACPNPHCTSLAHVQKHISQKPDCMAYAQAWRQAYSAQYPAKAGIVDAFTQSLICQAIVLTPNEPSDDMRIDDTISFPDNDDDLINNSNYSQRNGHQQL